MKQRPPIILASELVRALRGRRSQRALGRRLGFTSNVLYAWESGRRFPNASTFFRLVARAGVALLRMPVVLDVPAPLPDLTRPAGVTELLSLLVRRRSSAELARAIDADRGTVARWLAGRTEPKLPELLRIVDATTQRLLDVVAQLVDPARLPSVAAAWASLSAQRRLAYELPHSHAVLRALELAGYRALPRHRSAFVAACVGLPIAEVDRMLHALRAAGQIRLRKRRYQICQVLTVDTRRDPAANLRLKRHWSEVALGRLEAALAAQDGFASYNVFAISEAGYERVKELHVEYYERVRELIENDRDPQRVVLSNLQLIPLQYAASTQ